METTLLRSARRLPPVRHRGAPPRATTARRRRFGRARLTAVARRTTTRTTTRGRTTVAMRRARTRVLHLRRRLPRACPRRCCRLRARWGRCAHPRCRAQAQWKPTAQRKAQRRELLPVPLVISRNFPVPKASVPQHAPVHGGTGPDATRQPGLNQMCACTRLDAAVRNFDDAVGLAVTGWRVSPVYAES